MSSLEKDILDKANSSSSTNYGELRKLVSRKSVSQLKDALVRSVKNNPLPFWDALLKAFPSESKDKRFDLIKEFLKFISSEKNVLSIKKTSDLITRLCLDLHSFPNSQLVDIVEHCMNGVRVGNGKDVSWKDLLPQTLITLTNQNKITVNDVEITGQKYRDNVIANLTCAKWNTEILIPLANLFVDLNLNPSETSTVLKKFCNKLQQLSPPELPSLAYQLFTLSKTASNVTTVILAFQEYFHLNYYTRLFADLESNSTDVNSIDNFSEKEIRESEETILHHLSYCTQYKISEIQVCCVLRNLTSLPELLLRPFVLSAFLSLTIINREPESSRLSHSYILSMLKTAVKNNEAEKDFKKHSAWARGVLNNKSLDLEIMLNILIDQNKDGRDVITPGLVNFMFLLLKDKKSHQLNNIAIGFLTRFIRKRFIFGQGIIKKLADWMIVEQDSPQYSECLTNLSISDTFTVSECTKTIQYVLDFLLNVSGKQAMNNMLFILPIVKISHTIRDSFIDVLRRSMTSKDADVFEMGVYGFCKILKQLTNNNSQRGSNISGNMTQLSISGFSLISQATVGNKNNPQRHFDMLVLEVIGLLRNCFQQVFQIKKTLYENLMRAAELKTELIPHILQFIDFHFRSYFTVIPEEDICEIHFENIKEDNLGLLTNFVTNCVFKADNLNLNYETSSIKNVLDEIVAKTIDRSYKFPGETPMSTVNQTSFFIAVQCMNFIEALIAYLLRTSSKDNENVKNICELFKIHISINKNLKNAVAQAKKMASKKGKVSQAESQGNNTDYTLMKKTLSKMESVWDFNNIEKLLRLLFDEAIDFASETSYAQLRTNREVIQYVLQVAALKIENIQNEPDYKQISHSSRVFKYLTDISGIILDRLHLLDSLWANFDSATAGLICQCLFSILETVENTFPKKFDTFLKESNFSTSISTSQSHVVDILEMLIEKSISDEMDSDEGKKIPSLLLKSLEIIFRNLPSEDHHCINGFTWSLKFCENNAIKNSDHGLIHKILFNLRERTFSGEYLKPFALELRRFYGIQDDEKEDEDEQEMKIKSISEATVEDCCNYLFNTLSQKLDHIDYLIAKTNSMQCELELSFREGQSIQTENMKIVEKTICHHLLAINQSLLVLTDTTWPLGPIMNAVLTLLMKFFNTMTNLTKHFITRHSVVPMTSAVKFDELLREVGRPLGQNTYALMPYIDNNIFQGTEKSRKANASAAKAKVLKETKLIPKLILKIEIFNKFVISLSKKTKKEYNKFLHIGTVRDFRIRTSELKSAIDKSLDHSSQIDDHEDENEEENSEEEEGGGDGEEEEEMQSTFCSQEKENPIPNASNETNVDLAEESTNHSESQVMRNLDKINRKARRRSTKEKEVEEEPRPKRGRRAKK
ncbi:FANCI family protein [Megaselia abdita]